MSDSNKIYKTGIFNNQKIFSLDDVPVKGKIPEWLNGSYFRNGPGAFKLQHQDLKHWFDAMGALHKFQIKNGKVSYRNEFINCGSYRYANEHGRLGYSEFATDPCRSIFKKVQSYFIPSPPNMTDNPKVNVGRIADKYFAWGETPIQVEFDPETLKTKGFKELLPGKTGYKTTAHPHFDPQDAYNLVVKFGMFSYYSIYSMTHAGSKPLAQVPVKRPAYLHGFGMSKNYFIIAQGPLTVLPIELLFWKKPYIENHVWNEKEGAEIIVMEKQTGKVRARVKTDPFFSFHHINAWEENNEVVFDLNAYEDASIIEKYYLKELENPNVELPFGRVKRFRVNLSNKKLNSEYLSDACIELPRIDYARFNTKPDYRFVYGVSLHPEKRKGFYNSLVKIDVQSGKNSYWHESDCYPGEPFFVPSPGSKNDEEGVLISVVLNSTTEVSFLLILDAINMKEIARAELPEPVLYGFHGEFFGDL
jgi:beta,beta-carotene 9',10'-dioxygenase